MISLFSASLSASSMPDVRLANTAAAWVLPSTSPVRRSRSISGCTAAARKMAVDKSTADVDKSTTGGDTATAGVDTATRRTAGVDTSSA
eukprot:6012749-Pyramimonas_sp.AAC.1